MDTITRIGNRSVFHHSLAVGDIAAARAFYGETLGCPEILDGKRGDGRSDFDFFGHHLAVKEVDPANAVLQREAASNYYARHFGVFLEWGEWESLVERLKALSVKFATPPSVHGVGTSEESGSVQLVDPSGNGIEFKTARDPEAWFRQ